MLCRWRGGGRGCTLGCIEVEIFFQKMTIIVGFITDLKYIPTRQYFFSFFLPFRAYVAFC
jgi:hypothetical protein